MIDSIICGWMSSAYTSPLGPTRWARRTVNQPPPAPTSATTAPSAMPSASMISSGLLPGVPVGAFEHGEVLRREQAAVRGAFLRVGGREAQTQQRADQRRGRQPGPRSGHLHSSYLLHGRAVRLLGIDRRRGHTSGRVALSLPTGEKGEVTRHRLHVVSDRADVIRNCRVRLLVFGLECSEIRARYKIPPGAPDDAGDREDDRDGAESDRGNCPVHMASVPRSVRRQPVTLTAPRARQPAASTGARSRGRRPARPGRWFPDRAPAAARRASPRQRRPA